MKIAITAKSDSLEAPVDLRFGRAAVFIIYDTETEKWEAVDNSQNLNSAQGAGIQAGMNVAATGAEAVITGHCGPKAFRVLNEAEIKIYLNSAGTVAETIKMFKDGKLQEAAGNDVESHWS